MLGSNTKQYLTKFNDQDQLHFDVVIRSREGKAAFMRLKHQPGSMDIVSNRYQIIGHTWLKNISKRLDYLIKKIRR